ncbi:hypothetical protein ABIB81_003059 [Bradyrhizobium sp. I1.7.5]
MDKAETFQREMFPEKPVSRSSMSTTRRTIPEGNSVQLLKVGLVMLTSTRSWSDTDDT